MSVTEAQRRELERLVALKLPASYLKNGFPGLPSGNLDMRSVAALERRGFVECIKHRWTSPAGEARIALTYRATDAGRAALVNADLLISIAQTSGQQNRTGR